VWVTVAVAVAVVAVFSYEATRTNARPSAQAVTALPTPDNVTTRAPGATVSGYQVEAGKGGTGVAVDGRTPIGYAPDCSGAVAAATNYYVAVMEGLYQDTHTSESFAELLLQINGGLDGMDAARTGPMGALVLEFEAIRAQVEELGQTFPGFEYHPEWGAFRVGDCAERASATVDVAGIGEATVLAPGYSFCDGARVRVSWFGDDWRLAGLEHLALDENPGASAVPVDARAPLPASLRQAMIAAAGSGWGEYTNAPKD
jgi:hypothetical protein